MIVNEKGINQGRVYLSRRFMFYIKSMLFLVISIFSGYAFFVWITKMKKKSWYEIVETNFRKLPYIQAVFGQEFLKKIEEEQDEALLIWVVRELFYGSEGLQKLETGLQSIQVRFPNLLQDINSLLNEAFRFKKFKFKEKLISVLAEIFVLDYFINRSGLDIKRISVLEPDSSGKRPDFEIEKDNDQIVYVEVKQIQDISELENLLSEFLQRESILDPKNFAFMFEIQVNVSTVYNTLSGVNNRRYVEECVEVLRQRQNKEDVFSIQLSAFPNLTVDVKIKKGSGIYIHQVDRGHTGHSIGDRREFLLLGNVYSKIIAKAHDAYSQIYEFRLSRNLPIGNEDWVYIKADKYGLDQFVFQDKYEQTLLNLVKSMKIPRVFNLVVDGKIYK